MFSNLKLVRIAFLPKSSRIAIMGVIFLCVMLIGYVVDIKSMQNRLISLNARQKKLMSKINVANFKINTLPKLIDKKHKLELMYASYSKYFVTDLTFSNVLNDLTQMAKISQINLQVLRPGKTAVKNTFRLYPVQITATANYSQLVKFCQCLLELKYSVIISQFTIRNIPGSEELIFSVEFTGYKSSQNLLSLQGLKNFQAKKQNINVNFPKFKIVHDPFALDTNNKTYGLKHWPCEELQLLGVIQQGTQVWAVVQDPAGGIYHVTYGMKLGAEQSKIVKITAQEIVTANPKDNVTRNAME